MKGRPDLIRRAAAEGIGVLALVLAGCGAIRVGAVIGALAYQLVRGEHPAELHAEGT